MIDPAERLQELKEMVENSNTVEQFQWRLGIYKDLLAHLENSDGDIDKFYDLIWADYRAWCAWFITTASGHPLFLTPWQYELYELYYKYDDVWAMLPRRNGKTTGSAAVILYDALTRPNAHILLLAPTSDQMVVMKEIRAFLGKPTASEIFERFIGDTAKGSAKQDGGTDRLGSVFNQQSIRFLNGSLIESHNLNVKQKGATKRGLSADTMVIDEFALLPPEVMNEVVMPIIMDSHVKTRKKLVRIGTPDDVEDKDMRRKWAEAVEDSSVGCLTTNCWEAVEAGIRLPSVMKRRFSALGIPCEYVRECGACPVYIPALYEKLTGKKAPEFEHCPCGSVTNRAYVQEDLAQFHTEGGIGLSDQWIDGSGQRYLFTMPELLPKGERYIISADWGDTMAESWIGIWQIVDNNVMGESLTSIRLVYREVITDSKRLGIKNPTAARMKHLYHTIHPVRIFVDVTGKKEQINEMIRDTDPYTHDRIPWPVFETNKPAESNGAVGMWMSGPFKAEVMNHMVECYRNGRVIVPMAEQGFWHSYTNELKALRPEEGTSTRPYVRWPDTLHMTDSVSLACWYLEELQNMRDPFEGIVYSDPNDLFATEDDW